MTASLVRLLQLASPALPVGGYSYSQGLEAAVESGIVRDAPGAATWIGDLLDHVLPRGELAVLARLLYALRDDDPIAFARWHGWLRAARESRELRAEAEQMGAAMTAWARDVQARPAEQSGAPMRAGAPGTAAAPADAAGDPLAHGPLAWTGAWAAACHADGVAAPEALTTYAFAWLENQVLAAMKLVPLGQVAGQRMLRALAARIPAAVDAACATHDDDVSVFAPGFALASMRHETQYSRLFRS